MGRNKENPCREFFEYDRLKNKSKCTLCNTDFSGDHASNLERHLRRHHEEEYSIIQNKKQKTEDHTTEVLENFAVPKYFTVKFDKKTIIDACVELVTVNGCAFELMEYSGFRKILNPITAAVGHNFSVNAENIKQIIPQRASTIVSLIRSKLEKRMLSLKVDVATRLSRSILGINAQFVEDGKIHLLTLSMKELKERHTGMYIKNVVRQALEKYNIGMQQIYSVITNMIKFVDLLADDDCESESPGETDFEVNIYDDDTLFCKKQLIGIKCAAHTLQLAIKDALKDAELGEFLSDCRDLVQKLHIPTLASSFSENRIKKPVLDCPTRWNSTYFMLETLLGCKNLCSQLAETNLTYYFPEDKWDNIKTILDTLNPLKELTMKLQSEQLTMSDFFGMWMKTKLQLENITHSFARVITEKLTIREKLILENDYILGAVYLDPRYQILINSEQKAKAVLHLKNVWEMLEVSKEENDDTDKNSSELIVVSDEEDDEMEKYIKRKEKTANLQNNECSVDIQTILLNFDGIKRIDRKKNILEFWEENRSKYPHLYKIAVVVLGAPTTQVSVERIFSALKFILRDSLRENMLEDILIIKGNHDCF